MKKNDHLIWTNDGYYETYRKVMDDEHPEMSDKEKHRLAYDLNQNLLYDIREKLEIYLNQPILLIGRYGLYGNVHTGISEIGSRSIQDCLYSNDDKVTWYVDTQGDLRCDSSHEAGRNHYLYRTWKDDVSLRQKQMMLQKVSEGKPVERELFNLTRPLGKEISKAFGWKQSKKKK